MIYTTIPVWNIRVLDRKNHVFNRKYCVSRDKPAVSPSKHEGCSNGFERNDTNDAFSVLWDQGLLSKRQ